MFDFLCTAVRCLKSHRFAAFIVGCVLVLSILGTTIYLVHTLSQYDEFSINLLDLVEIQATR